MPLLAPSITRSVSKPQSSCSRGPLRCDLMVKLAGRGRGEGPFCLLLLLLLSLLLLVRAPKGLEARVIAIFASRKAP